MKTEKPDEVDFNNLSDISGRVDEILKEVKKEEMKVNLSKLDQKFLEKLGQSEFIQLTDKLNKTLDKTISTSNKGSTVEGTQIKATSYSWFNFVLAAFLLVVIATSGLMVYIWPEPSNESGDQAMEAFTGIAEDAPKPQIQMKPSSVTQAGFVKEDSTFVFEVEGDFEGDPEEVISITPNVPLEIETESEGDVTILTAIPQEPLEREENYMFTVKAGTQFSDGSSLEESLEWVIPVEPHFKVLSSYPVDAQENVPTDSVITFAFSDEDFTLESFSENFSISPVIAGVFEKTGENILFKPEGRFESGVKYLASIQKGLSITDGESLDEDFIISFITEGEELTDVARSQSKFGWVGAREQDITRVEEVIQARTNIEDLNQQIDYTVYLVVNGKHRDIMRDSEILGIQDMIATDIDSSDYIVNEDIDDNSVGSNIGRDEEKELIEEIELDDTMEDVLDNSVLLAKKSISAGSMFEYSPRSKGFYLLSATMGDQTIYQYFLVTQLGVVVTEVGEGMQGWIFNMYEAKDSMEGLFAVYDEDGELIDTGTTDKSGYFRSQWGKYLIVRYGEDMNIWENSNNFTEEALEIEDVPAEEGAN